MDPTDPVVYSFVVTGCNRLDKEDVSNSNPSTTNYFQINKLFDDFQQFSINPNLIVFTGDIVLGYSPDQIVLKNQLEGFKSLLSSQLVAHTISSQIVILPGNHEVMPGKNLPANERAEKIFKNSMHAYILGNDGPKANEEDGLLTNQDSLSYSFIDKNFGFVFLNSDPVGKESTIPYKWLRKVLESQKFKSTTHKFVFTHKPAFPYNGEDGLVNSFGERDSAWNVLINNQVLALFSSHNHLYSKFQPNPKNPWQIIIGNGGSPLSKFIKTKEEQFFGFSLVTVHSSGKVKIKIYGHDLPNYQYFTDFKNTISTVRDSLIFRN